MQLSMFLRVCKTRAVTDLLLGFSIWKLGSKVHGRICSVSVSVLGLHRHWLLSQPLKEWDGVDMMWHIKDEDWRKSLKEGRETYCKIVQHSDVTVNILPAEATETVKWRPSFIEHVSIHQCMCNTLNSFSLCEHRHVKARITFDFVLHRYVQYFW